MYSIEAFYRYVKDKHNGDSLEKIIEELLNEHPSIFASLHIDDFTGLSKYLSVTRNWYNHFHPKNHDKAAKGADLIALTKKACYIFEVCLFDAIKMDDELISNTIFFSYILQ
jgi:hypothetical protein